MSIKRNFASMNLVSKKNVDKDQSIFTEVVSKNNFQIVEALLKKSNKEENAVDVKLQGVNDLIKELKTMKTELTDMENKMIKLSEKRGNPDRKKEFDTLLENYNNLIEPLESKFSTIVAQKAGMSLDLGQLLSMFSPKGDQNTKEIENATTQLQDNPSKKQKNNNDINLDEVVTFEDMMTEYKGTRAELKQEKTSKTSERKAILDSVSQNINGGVYKKEHIQAFLDTYLNKLSDSTKQDFKNCDLDTNHDALLGVAKLVEVYGYDAKSITTDFLENEQTKISSEIKNVIEKSNKISEEINAFGEKNVDEPNKLFVALDKNPELANKFIEKQAQIQQGSEKLSFVKSLDTIINREKNFKNNIANTMYL